MKKAILLSFMPLFVSLHLCGQQPLNVQPVIGKAVLPAYAVKVGWDHTTALVFPAKVVSVDRGHAHILAKVEKKAPNLLWLKAGQRDFVPTNLHVVTADARLYHFQVSYGEALSNSSINVSRLGMSYPRTLQLDGLPVNEEKLKLLTGKVVDSPSFLNRNTKQYRMKFQLEGIYQSNGVLFFRLKLLNRSKLAYLPKELSFAITDRKLAKNTSVREQFVQPVMEKWGKAKGVAGEGENTLVLAFSQFTLSDKKHFKIHLNEENGDRDLVLSIRSKDILKVRNLPNVQPKKQ